MTDEIERVEWSYSHAAGGMLSQFGHQVAYDGRNWFLRACGENFVFDTKDAAQKFYSDFVKSLRRPTTPQEAAKVLLEWSGDYMPDEARVPAVKGYLQRARITDPVAINSAWFAALRAIAGEDQT